LKKYVSDEVGLPTLNDILQELTKPGRDPRKQFELFSFQDGVEKLTDLKPGMKLPGIVTNVTAFGAFVDIGVHQDGLVHVSQLADRFVSNPAEVVKVQQKVQVTVVEVDLERKRIALSMRINPELPGTRPARGESTGPRSERSPASQKRDSSPASKPAASANDWFSTALDAAQKRKTN